MAQFENVVEDIDRTKDIFNYLKRPINKLFSILFPQKTPYAKLTAYALLDLLKAERLWIKALKFICFNANTGTCFSQDETQFNCHLTQFHIERQWKVVEVLFSELYFTCQWQSVYHHLNNGCCCLYNNKEVETRYKDCILFCCHSIKNHFFMGVSTDMERKKLKALYEHYHEMENLDTVVSWKKSIKPMVARLNYLQAVLKID